MTKKAARWWLVGLGVGLPLFYILSPGPVMKMMGDPGSLGGFERFLMLFYWPLETMYNKFEIVEDFYDWWFSIWGVR